jgi:2-dehydropantoate 2-reductase
MKASQSPQYLIYGAGAIGSVLGGFLHKMGGLVTLAGRGEHFRALSKRGLQIRGIWGEHFIPPEELRLFSDGMQAKRFPVILLCVKSKDTIASVAEAAPLLEEGGIMISMQNGLDNWESVAEGVGQERTVGARVIFGAEIEEPGRVRVTVNADDVLLGEPFLPVNRSLLERIQRDLSHSGIPIRIVSKKEIWAAIWGKVLYNCSLNPLGALLEVPYGKLGESPETREIMRQVIREIFLVIQAKGIEFPFRDGEEYFHFLLETLLPPTVDHRASMLQDILVGRKTEIDALNGAISRYAQEYGLATPYNDLLTALIKFKEERNLLSP